MRITQNMIASNSLINLQQGLAKLGQLQNLTATGNNINQPSDDPIATSVLLDIGDQLKAGDQYASNITKANTFMQVTSTALQGMADTMTQAKQLVDTIASGTNDTTQRQSVVVQLQSLKQTMIDYGNTQSGDQYVFGGANNSTQPFSSKLGDLTTGNSTIANIDVTGLSAGMQVYGTGIPAGSKITAVSPAPPTITLNNNVTATAASTTLDFYAGDETGINIEIGKSTTQQMNIPGNQVLMGSSTSVPANTPYGNTNILDTFDKLITAVQNNDVTSAVGIQSESQTLENGANQITNAQSDVASRMIRLQNATTMNTNTTNTLQTISGSIQNVDYTKLAMELTQQQTAYQASLSTTAKVTQMSLLNYISAG